MQAPAAGSGDVVRNKADIGNYGAVRIRQTAWNTGQNHLGRRTIPERLHRFIPPEEFVFCVEGFAA